MPTVRTVRPLPGDAALADDWQAPVGENLPATIETASEETALERLLSSLKDSGGNASVKLYRKTDDAPRGEWCGDFTIEEYNAGGLKFIRRKYGPGHYFIWVYGPHPESGKFGRLARDDFDIAGEPDVNPATPAPIAPDSTLARVLETLAQGQMAIVSALNTRPDPATEMQRMLSLMSAMRDAMGLNVQPVATVAAPAPSASSVLGEVVGAIKALREANREIGGDDGDREPGVMSLAGKVIDAVQAQGGLGAALAGLGVNVGAPSPGLPPITMPPSVAGAAQGNPVAPDQQPAELAPDTMEILILRGTLTGLLDLMAKGVPATEGGAYVADKLPDEMLPLLDLPNWFEVLHMGAARVGVRLPLDNASVAWIGAARDEALRLLDAPDEP